MESIFKEHPSPTIKKGSSVFKTTNFSKYAKLELQSSH